MSIGPWQPLWLGEPAQQLYAALHRRYCMNNREAAVSSPRLPVRSPQMASQHYDLIFMVRVIQQDAATNCPCQRCTKT